MASLLDGREVAAAIQQQVAEDIASLRQSADVTPRLAVVLNGEDSASQAYVGRKTTGGENARD